MCGGNLAGGVDASCSGLACLVPGELCSKVLSGAVFSDSGTWIPAVLLPKTDMFLNLVETQFHNVVLPDPRETELSVLFQTDFHR